MSTSRDDHPGVALFVCDAGPQLGIGHVMRSIALAEELAARGHQVLFVADVGLVPWVAGQLAGRGFGVRPPRTGDPVAGVLADVAEHRPTVLVLDSYQFPVAGYAALRSADGPVLVAFVDGDPGGRAADVYVDQNIGAEGDTWSLAADAIRLAGLSFAMMRSDILGLRPATPRVAEADAVAPVEVLAFFGGTDAFGAAPALTRALVATGAPFALTVVAATEALAAELNSIVGSTGQQILVIAPTSEIADLISRADLVVSAAGTSSWELCCLGAAAALVWVAENQHEAYLRAVDLELVGGLGALADLRAEPGPAIDTLRRLLLDPAARARLRATAWAKVDGRGRSRVAETVAALRHPR